MLQQMLQQMQLPVIVSVNLSVEQMIMLASQSRLRSRHQVMDIMTMTALALVPCQRSMMLSKWFL